MTNDDAQRLASWHLLESLQRAEQSADARNELFESMLQLDAGFWQCAEDKHPRPETLKGFVLRTAHRVVQQQVQLGVRATAIDPEDLCQDILVTFFRFAASIRTNPRGWLVGVAVRLARGALRAESRYLLATRIDDQEFAAPPGPTDEPDSPTVESPDQESLQRAIEKLPTRIRVVVSAHLDGKSTQEIAQDLAVAEPTIRKRLSRGRLALHELLRGTRRLA